MNRDPVEPNPRTPLSDSPWFWMALFGFMAMIAVAAIQGKFSQRQARLEQRYQDLLIAQQARARVARLPTGPMTGVERGYEQVGEEPVAVSMAEARAKTSLVPLLGVAAGVALVGIAGLAWSRRAARTADVRGPCRPDLENGSDASPDPQKPS